MQRIEGGRYADIPPSLGASNELVLFRRLSGSNNRILYSNSLNNNGAHYDV